jgi:AcrR family transcriptional regulator
VVKVDIRILKTKNKLYKAFISLIDKERIKDITVLELCKEAKVNRTTFYKYYLDVEDFTNKYEEELLEELKVNIKNINRNYLLSFTNNTIETIKKDKSTYLNLLGPNGDANFLKKILYIVKNESIEEWHKLLKKATENDLNHIYNFIVDGITGIINEWIKSNCKEDSEQIEIFINKICMSGLSSFI